LILILLGIAALFVAGFLVLSLGTGALLNWITPTVSWEFASLLSSIALMSVLILSIFLVAAISRIDFDSLKSKIDDSDEVEWEEHEDDLEDLDGEPIAVGVVYSNSTQSSRHSRTSNSPPEFHYPRAEQLRSHKKRNRKK
jgi:hypothetical protein